MAQTQAGALKVAAKRANLPLDIYVGLVRSGMKWCWKCRKLEPKEMFGKDASRVDGLDARCAASKRVEVRKSTKGRPSPNRGRKYGTSNGSGRKPGFVSEKRGIPRPIEVRARISSSVRSVAKRGEECRGYIDGRGVERLGLRYSSAYKQWRFDVYCRDRFTCQDCGDRRGSNLHAHHILPFSTFEFSRFVVSNGITLCRSCHRRVHGRSN